MRGWSLSWVVLAGTLGCSSQQQPATEGLGKLRMDLAVTVATVDYRLRSARFDLKGPVHSSLASEDLADTALALVAAVPGGDYVVTLADGWQLEREDLDGAVVLDATLESANPSDPIVVTPGATVAVPLQFSTAGVALVFGGLAPLQPIP